MKSIKLTPEEIEAAVAAKVEAAAPIGFGIGGFALAAALLLAFARASSLVVNQRNLIIGFAGVALTLIVDYALVSPLTTSGVTTIMMVIPWVMIYYGARDAVRELAKIELLRVVFPPLILIVAVLGSILGGITNPTPAAGLGAGGALMLAAFRKLKDENKSTKIILQSAFAIVICILIGVNFDLRINSDGITAEGWIAFYLPMPPICMRYLAWRWHVIRFIAAPSCRQSCVNQQKSPLWSSLS